MKKIVLLLLVVLVVFVILMRHRLFVRDPLGSVVRNGVKEQGAQVYINKDNDVLIENDRAPMYLELIQPGRVGSPAVLHCLHWLLCLTDADQATLAGTITGAHIEEATPRSIRLHDGPQRETVVNLR